MDCCRCKSKVGNDTPIYDINLGFLVKPRVKIGKRVDLLQTLIYQVKVERRLAFSLYSEEQA